MITYLSRHLEMVRRKFARFSLRVNSVSLLKI